MRAPAIVTSALSLVVTLAGCVAGPPEGDAAARRDALASSLHRERATVVRDQGRSLGVENPLLLAGIAQGEVNLAHCWSEATWACQGPASADCGGGPVVAGSADGPCSSRQGGLGMFQFDGGDHDDTLARDGARVLTVGGSVAAAVDFVADMLVRSIYVPEATDRASALAWMADVRVGTADYERWIRTVTHYYNGCRPDRCSVFRARFAHYDAAARLLLERYGEAFWYGAPAASPPSAVAGLSRPFTGAFGVTSYVSHAGSSGSVDHACNPVSRSRHKGTDFGLPSGTEVLAAADGTVIRSADGCPATGSLGSRCGGGFGNHVMVLHDGGRATLYAHLTPRSGIPRVGERVACGDRLGLSGSSGRSTGPHLHFEVREGVTNATDYFSRGATDPYGGACSSQPESLWAGGSPMALCASGDRDDARVASASQPDPVPGARAGQALTQRWTLENTGSTTWTPEDGHHLALVDGASFGGPERLDLDGPVAPGETWEAEITVTVPDGAGTHRVDYQMRRDAAARFGEIAHLTVEVAAAPSGCSSATLGRDVPHGTCVQVDYPGCGAESCAWYGCHDGSWYCTEPSACGGEQHPNAACGGERSCASMTLGRDVPSGECVQVDYPGCGAESCSWYACSDGAWTCTPLDACASEQHGNAACGAGACKELGRACADDTECCDESGATQCLLGFCVDTAACGLVGEGCGSSSECCGMIACAPQAPGGSGGCCLRGDDPCGSDADCCGRMTCGAGGRCVHREIGESCVTHFECAGGAFCTDDDVCGFE